VLGAEVQALGRDLESVLGPRRERKRPLELVLVRRLDGVANVELVAMQLES
jgi:hypothetical protein